MMNALPDLCCHKNRDVADMWSTPFNRVKRMGSRRGSEIICGRTGDVRMAGLRAPIPHQVSHRQYHSHA